MNHSTQFVNPSNSAQPCLPCVLHPTFLKRLIRVKRGEALRLFLQSCHVSRGRRRKGSRCTKGTVATRWNLIMAGPLIGAVSVLILYAAAQRYFVQGIALTGLKT